MTTLLYDRKPGHPVGYPVRNHSNTARTGRFTSSRRGVSAHPRPEEATITTAVLFDVDGTLVDSNYLHVHAWHRAFHRLGRDVDSWRVHRAIGKGSGKLLATLLGDEDADRIGDEVKELHSRFYLETASLLRPFDQAPELIRALAGHGVRVVLATSAGADELKELRRVLDVDDVVSGIVSGADVERRSRIRSRCSRRWRAREQRRRTRSSSATRCGTSMRLPRPECGRCRCCPVGLVRRS